MKKIKKVLFIIILMAIVGTITFFVGRQIGLNTDTSTTSTTIEEVSVGTQTIKKTLTSSGEIKSSGTKKLELSTSYYFETMCVEEDDTVKQGENILKYTNGTYLTAPYDLVISSFSVPDTKKKATSSNYVEVQNLKDLSISLSINENEISNISLDQEVQISLTADSNKTYTGKITKIDSIGSYSASGTTFPVKVSLENDEYVQVLSGLEGGEKIQVVTTTKQSTIRSDGGSSSGFGGGMNFGGGSMPDFSGGSMPDFGGGMPSGSMSGGSRPSGRGQ